MSDEKPFDLRDKFATEAMHAIIVDDQSGYKLAADFIKGRQNNLSEWDLEKMERIALAAYAMADAMRKARLKAFG